MEFTEYIQSELLIAIPALYALGMFFKKCAFIEDRYIPILLGIVGMVLSVLYCLGQSGFSAGAIFTGMIQGIFVASASVYANQTYKQVTKKE